MQFKKGPKLQKTLVNRGPESNRQKSCPREILENGNRKTLIYVLRKIQNVILYRGESAMGKVSSATLGALFIRVKNPANAFF
jgi:hypothetical protein